MKSRLVWDIRFRSSYLWRFLPLLIVVAGTLGVAAFRILQQPGVTAGHSYSEADGQLLCNRLCDGLMYCFNDALEGRDETTKKAVRSACYTGCRKHEEKLVACEPVLRKEQGYSQAFCQSLATCLNQGFGQSIGRPVSGQGALPER